MLGHDHSTEKPRRLACLVARENSAHAIRRSRFTFSIVSSMAEFKAACLEIWSVALRRLMIPRENRARPDSLQRLAEGISQPDRSNAAFQIMSLSSAIVLSLSISTANGDSPSATQRNLRKFSARCYKGKHTVQSEGNCGGRSKRRRGVGRQE